VPPSAGGGQSQKVINLFGQPNREKYGIKAINRIVNALKKAGHQAISLEGDKDLIDNLEAFMPRAPKGERPGMGLQRCSPTATARPAQPPRVPPRPTSAPTKE